MSAHILGDENLDAIIKGCQAYFKSRHINAGSEILSLDSEKDLNRLGQILKDENYRSVNTKYNESEVGFPYEYPYDKEGYSINKPVLNSTIQLLKICDCYDYQSCEAGDYNSTIAFKVIDYIRGNLIKLLPGYDDAKWEL